MEQHKTQPGTGLGVMRSKLLMKEGKEISAGLVAASRSHGQPY